ncbi:MAG: homing endonuclease associated repeat-containing protein [Hyphomonas sp.]
MTDPKFKVERVPGTPVSDEELIADIQRVAEQVSPKSLSFRGYSKLGTYHPSTATVRFGSWNAAILAAGLTVGMERNISDEVLFQNLMQLWEHYGRQPRVRELTRSPSTISYGPYERRFRSWTNALEAFAGFANSSGAVAPSEVQKPQTAARSASLRTRFRILKRDNFRCCACGASPAITPGLVLHVDHKTPWSHGGETIDENLQTLCEPCNQGKSNLL